MHPHDQSSTNEGLVRRDRMRTRAAAKYLGVSASLLEKLRLRGTGPRYAKLGKAVIYERGDLDDWADAAKRRSTSEPAAAWTP
jgi:predicted DNA-binding transcriptional regulator AlpA